MPQTPLTRHQGGLLVKMIIVGMVVQLSVVGYVAYSSWKGHDDTAKNSQAGCERTKQDRKDNADFQTAQKNYINKVVLAQSVKPDVKNAAREAIKTFDRTSASLTKRAKIDCDAAFPKGGIFP
jgi:uncharacterized membrane protein YebE (DUF533 family)